MLREFAKIIGIDNTKRPVIVERQESNDKERQLTADYLAEKIELPEYKSELNKLPRPNFIQALVRLHSKT